MSETEAPTPTPTPRPARYPIAAVSKLTGVTCHALRIWERRYGFPVPVRSDAGHRRYGAEQVEQIRQVARLVQGGRSVARVIADLHDGRLAPAPEPAPAPEAAAAPSRTPAATGGVAGLLDRLEAGDLAGAEAEYRRLVEGLDVTAQLQTVLEPALTEVGERWFRRQCEVFQEHCASTFLRRKLTLLDDAARARNRTPLGTILTGTVRGERHEGGVLIAGILIELAGWRAVPLGVDLPTQEFQRAIDRWQPQALALSFVLSRSLNRRFEELSRLRGAPVFVAGQSLVNHQRLAIERGLIPVPGPGPLAVQRLLQRLTPAPPPRAARALDAP